MQNYIREYAYHVSFFMTTNFNIFRFFLLVDQNDDGRLFVVTNIILSLVYNLLNLKVEVNQYTFLAMVCILLYETSLESQDSIVHRFIVCIFIFEHVKFICRLAKVFFSKYSSYFVYVSYLEWVSYLFFAIGDVLATKRLNWYTCMFVVLAPHIFKKEEIGESVERGHPQHVPTFKNVNLLYLEGKKE